MQLTHRFENAMVYASQIHAAQRRKGSNTPYIGHLLGVAALAIEAGADEDQAIAALLHDAAEDQGGHERLENIRARFGDRVAGIVSDCTDSWTEPKPAWRERKESYISSLQNKSPDSLLVSVADKIHNAGAIVADLDVCGSGVWDRFTGGKEGSLWYYNELVDAFRKHLPGTAAERFASTVAEMNHRSDRLDVGI